MNYNLLEEKWIPVLWKDGHTDRVSIVGALTQAGSIRQIAASNPMDRVAVLRFLLALLYWCKGNPTDMIPGKPFPRVWFKKLYDYKECFDLFGKETPFYQNRAAKRTGAVTNLIQEIPSGNNFWHFRHSTDKKDGLCPACCAIGLLRLPLFSVSGLSGPGEPNLMAGINGVPPVYVVPWRKSLFETLLANWGPCTAIGEPSWVRPGITQEDKNQEVPMLTGLTLLPRRVLLHDPVQEASACIACGEKGEVILTCVFQTAGRQENDKWHDPHVVYLDSTHNKALKAADLTAAGKFRMDRPWPALLARMLETGREDQLLVVGFATNKAKNIDAWERILPVPHSQGASESFKHWQKEGRGLEDTLRKIIRG